MIRHYAMGLYPFYPEQYAALCAVRRKTPDSEKEAVRFAQYAEQTGYSTDLCGYERAVTGEEGVERMGEREQWSESRLMLPIRQTEEFSQSFPIWENQIIYRGPLKIFDLFPRCDDAFMLIRPLPGHFFPLAGFSDTRHGAVIMFEWLSLM